MRAIFAISLLVAVCAAKVYFSETFDDTWEQRWVYSKAKDADGTAGKFVLSAGKYYNDAEKDKGLKTSENARFYLISSAIPEEFSNKGKKLIVQYQVKHEQDLDCGGGYLKLLPASAFAEQSEFKPDSIYNLMFGPDICGSTKKTHVIIGHEGKNYLVKREVRTESDEASHLYTLIISPDNTYEVRIDNKKVQDGKLEEDWDIVAPKQIQDPEAKKPADWVDEPDMPDPTDVKPADWDSIPAKIADKDAKKPEDWDDETDGEWEAPMIDNPEYKGEWKAKRIENPAYKGPWVHPMIANPAYKPMPELYSFDSFKYVGIDIWQVKSGSIFDNILITDDEAEAAEWAKKFEETVKGEKEMKKQAEEKEKAAKEAEEAAKKAEEAKKPAADEKKDEL